MSIEENGYMFKFDDYFKAYEVKNININLDANTIEADIYLPVPIQYAVVSFKVEPQEAAVLPPTP